MLGVDAFAMETAVVATSRTTLAITERMRVERLQSTHTWRNSVHRLEKAAVHFMSELRMLLGLHGIMALIVIDGILCARSTAYLPVLMDAVNRNSVCLSLCMHVQVTELASSVRNPFDSRCLSRWRSTRSWQ